MQIDFKKIREKFIRMPIIFHLLSAILVFCILSAIVLKGLKVYTRHNTAIIVPDVKGLQLEDAAVFFENSELRYTVIDSVYTKDVPPGAIIEIVPATDSKVKQGHIIFVTVNAKTAQTASVPDVADLSFRQAYALLQSRGFSSVDILYVSGRYRDLAIGVELRGVPLKPGDKVPIAAKLVLKVSDGDSGSELDENDTIPLPTDAPEPPSEKAASTSSENEKWF